MESDKKRKPFSTLAERLKSIRQRPLSQADVDELNEVFNKVDKESEKPTRKK